MEEEARPARLGSDSGSPDRKESHVEDREKITSSEPDVEAHRRKAKATDEGTTEGESEEDTELHARRVKLANEEASGETDDVELHAKKKL